jgi:DNA repair protein RadA/Sms
MLAPGELSLTGQIRSVPFLDLRLKEVEKMGYKRVVIPGSTYRNRAYSTGLEVLEVNTIEEFIDLIMEG